MLTLLQTPQDPLAQALPDDAAPIVEESFRFLALPPMWVLALLVVISNTPWYAPQYAIPLLGMVLGNTMNGIALGLDRLTHEASARRAVLEARPGAASRGVIRPRGGRPEGDRAAITRRRRRGPPPPSAVGRAAGRSAPLRTRTATGSPPAPRRRPRRAR